MYNVPLVYEVEGREKPGKDVFRDAHLVEAVRIPFLSRACQQLKIAQEQEPTPYVVRVHSVNEKSGSILVEHKNTKENVHSLLEEFKYDRSLNNEEKKEKTKIFLKIVRDCLEGAAFLQKHGLVLQDIKPDNLGIVRDEQGNYYGFLFDLDGLTREGDLYPSRYAAEGFFPPEVDKYAYSRVRATEMSFQFGKVLENMYDRYPITLNENERRFLMQVIRSLTCEDPDDRISVADAQTYIEKIINGEVQKKNEHAEGTERKVAA